MSSKKFNFNDLAKWKRIHNEIINCPGSPFSESSLFFPVDWCEFNKMFFSRRNVIVEYPKKFNISTLFLLGFYSALKIAKRRINIGLCRFGSRNGFPQIGALVNKLSNKSLDDNILFAHSTTPFKDYRNRVLECDEWILNAEDVNSQETIAQDINSTKGFSEIDVDKELWTANRALMGWRRTYEKDPWRRKFIVAWADSGRTQLDEILAKYPDQFLVIPYTKEKQLVDDWYAKNTTIVDPEFDIQLMNPEINPRKVLLYAATNHLYDFRNFARVLPDVVKDFISQKELKELM